ncbi:zinc finger protein 90-like [Anoplophora glabripennis]|uniref:zinc finger protein 90-like n=1 Tax=Anoplophora glabripennis TaxID=217634 RepID=UPI0008742B7E|nr:zinc finger protein 90-like [Anoplophora glabripennis]
MTSSTEAPCRLCLKTVTDKSFEVVDDATRNILYVLLWKLKFVGASEEVICNACKRKLDAAFEFKTMCLSTDNIITPYVNCEKMLQLDLREVYMKETGSELLTDMSQDQKICRLCMQLKFEYRFIHEKELEAIHNFAPEMNINIVRDPIVCKHCFDSLCTHNSFIKDCLEVEEKIGGICDSSASDSQTNTLSSNLFIKTEKLDAEFEIDEMDISVKPEFVEVKSEEFEDESDTSLWYSNNETFEKEDLKQAEKDGFTHRNESVVDHVTLPRFPTSTGLYKCGKCIYQTKSESRFRGHCARHDSGVYKCKTCDYKTTKKKLLQRHQLQHKDPSEVPMYRCTLCDFETKYKRNVIQHQVKHESPSETPMYSCEVCDFQSKYKCSINRHRLMHRDLSNVRLYKCNECDFGTRHKGSLTYHMLKHKDDTQVQMFSCEECDFSTKYKESLKKHRLNHKPQSEVQMFKCGICEYETRFKKNLTCHQLRHKGSSELRMYQCNDCDYGTRHKRDLVRHVLSHRNVLKEEKDKCD